MKQKKNVLEAVLIFSKAKKDDTINSAYKNAIEGRDELDKSEKRATDTGTKFV